MPYGFELPTNTPYWSTCFGAYTQYDIDDTTKQQLADWNYPLIPGSTIYRINEVINGGDDGFAPAVFYIAHVGLTDQEGYPPQWMLLWDDTRSLDDPPFMNPPGGDTGVEWVDGVPTIGGVPAINIVLENTNASNTALTDQAIKLNEGLSFTDGQWLPTE
jgi:hypothetical protein